MSFIAKCDEEQREQFILVNSTKPLQKSLIYELLPSTNARLPSLLERRRFPALLLDRLNYDEGSPLKHRIRTSTNTEGIIRDNSILKMLQNSLSDGVLYRYRDSENGEGDVDEMLLVLMDFWSSVEAVFKDAWNQPPIRSRLTHGAGIVSLGFLMDAIAGRHRKAKRVTNRHFMNGLGLIKDDCRWTDGYWDFGDGQPRKWNDLQNIQKDVSLLANHLLRLYHSRAWKRSGR